MVSIWDYRGLIRKIAVTDLKIRYKNSALGFIWSLLQPLSMMLVLYVVFTNLFKNSDPSYPLYLMIGVVSWGFFDKATSFSLNSIIGKAALVKKIYFPREVLVVSSCLTALMMSLIEFLIVGLFMLFYLLFPQLFGNFKLMPTELILLLPAVIILLFIFALGVSFAIASLNVRYRDMQWIWGVVMQVGFFLTPIMYSMNIFSGAKYAIIIQLNPVGVMMDMVRNLLIYNVFPSWLNILYSIAVSLVLIAVGWLIFKRLEPDFAEEV